MTALSEQNFEVFPFSRLDFLKTITFKRDKFFVGHREHFHGFVHVAFVSRVLPM